jgi:hypothetical protein
MKAYRKSKSKAALINLIVWTKMSGQLHAPADLPHRERRPAPVE